MAVVIPISKNVYVKSELELSFEARDEIRARKAWDKYKKKQKNKKK